VQNARSPAPVMTMTARRSAIELRATASSARCAVWVLKRIHRLGPIERDDGDAIFDAEEWSGAAAFIWDVLGVGAECPRRRCGDFRHCMSERREDARRRHVRGKLVFRCAADIPPTDRIGGYRKIRLTMRDRRSEMMILATAWASTESGAGTRLCHCAHDGHSGRLRAIRRQRRRLNRTGRFAHRSLPAGAGTDFTGRESGRNSQKRWDSQW